MSTEDVTMPETEEVNPLLTTTKTTKRSFIEALREFTDQQTSPNPKRVSVDAKATDTIRIEVNKVLYLIVSRSLSVTS